MEQLKLQTHLQLKHPDSVGGERSYFEKRVELRKKIAPKPLKFYINRTTESSIKTLRASYAVSKLFAKVRS